MGRWVKRMGPAALARFGLRLGLAGLLGTTFVGAGCASERDPIGRVQPNALSKHFFVGDNLDDANDDPTFRWRGYVVDGSASQSTLGVGSWSHVDRIKWEITETMLIARKSYPIADDRDVKGVAAAGKKVNDGTVVAAWPIESHFDIRRGYNTVTGEELNVVEENSSDRPWNAREYIRVDWGKNLVDSNPMWEEFFFGKLFGDGVQVTPVQYTVTDPADENAIHFENDKGYFDITTKYYVDPAKSYLARWNVTWPTCALYGIFTGSGTYECDAQEALVRWSFAKIDPQEDFEPLENTDAPEDIVGNPGGVGNSLQTGIVTAPRQSYDPEYGYTDKGLHRYANIHNVWKASHLKNADGSWITCTANTDANTDGTADECAGKSTSAGSQCDMAVGGRCTIPYRDREVKTVTYWINKDAPADLQDAVDAQGNPTSGPDAKGLPGFAKERGTFEDLIYSWNQLMRNGPAFSKEIECRRTGGEKAACHAQFFESTNDPKTKEMVSYGGWLVDVPKAAAGSKTTITMCHNPVRPYDDHDACGATGEVGRVGDVRKNFIFYWSYDSRAPWGGIANWEGDPLTGQAWGNAAQIMGRSATFAAAQQRDIIQLALGDITLDDIIQNTPADTYSKRLQDGRTPGMTAEEISRRLKSIDVANLRLTTGMKTFSGTADAKALDYMEHSSKSTNDVLLANNTILQSDAISKKLRGSQYEAELTSAHWMVGAMGAQNPLGAGEAALDYASPIRGMDPAKMRMMSSWFEQGLHEKGACFLDSEAPVTGSVYIPGVAGFFKKKYGSLSKEERGKKIYEDLWREAVKGIALHEIGHSLGMFHNFASSWDAQNYNPQYWQLRTNEGKSSAACAGPRTGDTDSCLGPRYIDPETKDEAGLTDAEPRPGIDYFSNTSTMEYQLERFGETVGLGSYDYQTMKFLYGRAVDVVDESVAPIANAYKNYAFRTYSQLGERDFWGSATKHYTEVARQMKTFDPARDCRDATAEEKAVASWRVVHGKVCATQPKDVWALGDFKSDCLKPSLNGTQCYSYSSGETLNGIKWHTGDKMPAGASDKHDRIRWQYRFGQTHNAYFHANDSDAGADPYEVVINTQKRFTDTYPWAYFRRQNREYYSMALPGRSADRYFDRIRSYHWLVATDLGRGGDITTDDDLRPYAMAETEMVKLLSNAILSPEPGGYGVSADRKPIDSLNDIYDSTTVVSDPKKATFDFYVGVPDGRFIAEEYDNDKGGSWEYLQFLKHPGYDYEKSLALQALVDGRPTLFTISRDNWLDGRDVKINFRNDMPNMIDRMVGGILSEDWETIAPHWNETTKAVDYLDLADPNPTRTTGTKVLFPNLGYKQQLATVFWTAIFSRANTDMTLVNKMRLWVEGAVDEIKIDDTLAVKYTDPTSGYTYVARKYGTDKVAGKTIDAGIASRVIAHANAMAIAAYEVKETAGKADTDVYGRPTYIIGTDGTAKIKDPTAAAKLIKYRGFIDALREVDALTAGPLGGGGSGGGGGDD